MTKSDEEKLIRFLNNKSSPREREEVLQWLESPGVEQELETWMMARWENDPVPVSTDEAYYPRLLQKIHLATVGSAESRPKPPRRISILSIARMAATYLLLLFSGYLLYNSWTPDSSEPLAEAVPAKTIERTTRAGEKLKVILPDKSEVTLNSLSTFRFDSNFGKKDRIISLDGEAYFEIASDPERPFKVHTGGVVTTALGTSFNAYYRDSKVEVALTEGKVRVSHNTNEVELMPGEMAIRAPQGEGLKTRKFNIGHTTAWKEGKIRFKSMPLAEIISTLETWYGVTIVVQGNVDRQRKVSGLFDNESLEEILKGICFSLDLEHTISGKKVTIKHQ